MISVAQPLLGRAEEEAVLNVIRSGQIAQGKQVEVFEKRFAEVCGVEEAIAVSSGTAALHLALLAHGVGVGDEVITTPFSFAATANVILLVGATPVFVDIDPLTYTLDPALVEEALSSRTKAIMPVHLYGHPCNMQPLMALAKKHSLAIIEDACQAHAAMIAEQPVGSFGVGCFSFYATKNITTGEGGMVTTNDSTLAERIRMMRSHGQRERYRQVIMGHNLRMTDMQGALGVVQVAKLETLTEKRIANAHYLTRRLQGVVQTPITLPGYRHVFHQYTIRVPKNRAAWIQQLQMRGVGTAIHYPIPIHKQPFYQEHPTLWRIGSQTANLSVAEAAAHEVLALPVHPALSEDDLATIAREVLQLCD